MVATQIHKDTYALRYWPKAVVAGRIDDGRPTDPPTPPCRHAAKHEPQPKASTTNPTQVRGSNASAIDAFQIHCPKRHISKDQRRSSGNNWWQGARRGLEGWVRDKVWTATAFEGSARNAALGSLAAAAGWPVGFRRSLSRLRMTWVSYVHN